MFIINGICYAGEPKTDIEVAAIKPLLRNTFLFRIMFVLMRNLL